MKRIGIPILLALVISMLLLSQTSGGATVSLQMTGTGATLNGSATIPLAPGNITATCPGTLQKGGSVPCTVSIDQPVPAGQNATITAAVVCPTGTICTISPASFTIPGGSATCGTAALACFTVSRQ